MIRKGIIKAFDSSTYLATVQIIGSLSVWLDNVPTSRTIAEVDMVAGRSIALLSLDPGNPSDSVIVAVWGEPASSHVDYIDRTHLSQDFGASGVRLANLIPTPKTGVICQFISCKKSPFSAEINGNPTAGGLFYDNDINEDMFAIFLPYTGSGVWGRVVLYNTTRGNSRLITSFNKWSNHITTASSSDDWANNDDITVQSQTVTQSGYFDIELSTKLAATDIAAFIAIAASDIEGNYDSARAVHLHPYETYDAGKRITAGIYSAYGAATPVAPIPISSQRLCLCMDSGCETVNVALQAVATIEYADT